MSSMPLLECPSASNPVSRHNDGRSRTSLPSRRGTDRTTRSGRWSMASMADPLSPPRTRAPVAAAEMAPDVASTLRMCWFRLSAMWGLPALSDAAAMAAPVKSPEPPAPATSSTVKVAEVCAQPGRHPKASAKQMAGRRPRGVIFIALIPLSVWAATIGSVDHGTRIVRHPLHFLRAARRSRGGKWAFKMRFPPITGLNYTIVPRLAKHVCVAARTTHVGQRVHAFYIPGSSRILLTSSLLTGDRPAGMGRNPYRFLAAIVEVPPR